jgi:hypothetical protein
MSGVDTYQNAFVAQSIILTSPADIFVVQQLKALAELQSDEGRVGVLPLFLCWEDDPGAFPENFENKNVKSCILAVFLCKIVT